MWTRWEHWGVLRRAMFCPRCWNAAVARSSRWALKLDRSGARTADPSPRFGCGDQNSALSRARGVDARAHGDMARAGVALFQRREQRTVRHHGACSDGV